jgi:histo-blood group ABO system transferase
MENKIVNKIGLIMIATNKYNSFLQPLIDSADEFFFIGDSYDIYVFTSDPAIELKSERATIYIHEILPFKFPQATLYRYDIMTRFKDWFYSEYLFYLDVDMKFVDYVGDDICDVGLTAVLHPGYWKGGWGSRHTHPASMAYLKPELWKAYCCGAFQGGKREMYLDAAQVMAEAIKIDLDTAGNLGYVKNWGILAEWHDETFWNWYLRTQSPYDVMTLPPSYCYPETWTLPLEKKIIALDKNHEQLRG